MPEGAIAKLSAELGVPADGLAVLARFNDEQIAVLSAAVRQAIATQRREMDASLEKTVRFVPRVLRGRARKVLFSGADGG